MAIKITFTNVSDGAVLREDVLSDAEVKALEVDMLDVPEWVMNSLANKARQCIDDAVEKSGQGSRYTDADKKMDIVEKLDLESAKAREEKLRVS